MDAQEEKRQGISLFKIDYEIDGRGDSENAIFSAGIIAYDSEEAVQELASFLRENITNFKGFRIDQLGFQGQVHHLSQSVRDQIIERAKMEGLVQAVVPPEQAEPKEEKKTPAKKKSVLKKDA